jgi:hypothetical protein
LDCVQRNASAFRLGDDFVLDDENVTFLQTTAAKSESIYDEVSDGIPGNNFADTYDRYDADFPIRVLDRNWLSRHQPVASHAGLGWPA